MSGFSPDSSIVLLTPELAGSCSVSLVFISFCLVLQLPNVYLSRKNGSKNEHQTWRGQPIAAGRGKKWEKSELLTVMLLVEV